jgi:small subunit ribosomal protein S6
MPDRAPIYDLMLLLSTEAADEDRAKMLTSVESAISGGGGSVERKQEWGTRAMTYPINHRSDAEYHLLQFSGPPSLLESLSHSLRIADQVLRFRIIKAVPGPPPQPDAAAPVMAAAPAVASVSDARDAASEGPPAAEEDAGYEPDGDIAGEQPDEEGS